MSRYTAQLRDYEGWYMQRGHGEVVGNSPKVSGPAALTGDLHTMALHGLTFTRMSMWQSTSAC